MKRFALLVIVGAFLPAALTGQTADGSQSNKYRNGILYFSAGLNRIWYTPSTIHVRRNEEPLFNFTLVKANGKDQKHLNFDEAPQYSYTIGYYLPGRKIGTEYQFDHVKYFVRANQVVRLRGNIEGKEYDRDTALTSDFFQLEHSDGANYAMLNVVKWISLAAAGKKILPQLILKMGAGAVIPKTNSTILGYHRDDRYHVSGYVVGVEFGMRAVIGKWFFVSSGFKGAFANYSHFLIAGGQGRQKWFSAQLNYLAGAQIPL